MKYVIQAGGLFVVSSSDNTPLPNILVSDLSRAHVFENKKNANFYKTLVTKIHKAKVITLTEAKRSIKH